jgi:hypothetical protein
MRSHDKDTGVGAGLGENYFVWSWAGKSFAAVSNSSSGDFVVEMLVEAV